MKKLKIAFVIVCALFGVHAWADVRAISGGLQIQGNLGSLSQCLVSNGDPNLPSFQPCTGSGGATSVTGSAGVSVSPTTGAVVVSLSPIASGLLGCGASGCPASPGLITLGTGLSFTGNVLNASGSAVSLTAGSANLVATPSPITGSGTIDLAATITGTEVSATVSEPAVTGAVERTFAARAADVFNVADFCTAPCTSSASQTAAFTAVGAAINANAGGVMWIPEGLNWKFNSATSGPIIFTTYGASVRGAGVSATTVTVSNGTFLEWTTATAQSNGGHGSLTDLRIFENDNNTSGAQVLLNNVDFFAINNVFMGGGFITLDIASSVAVAANNITLEGHNTTSGSLLLRLHRTNGSASNDSEIFFTNFDIRGDSNGAVTNAIRLSDCDGCFLANGHVGFSSGAALLIQAENLSDNIDGFHSTGVDYDSTTAGPGVDFETLASQTGSDGGHFFTGGSSSNMTGAGVVMNDSNLNGGVSFSGFGINGNDTHGLDIESGSNISVYGSVINCNNQTGTGSSHIIVEGTASYVTIDGVAFSQGIGSRCPNAVASNITIAGSAANIKVGPDNLYNGGTANITNTSGGAGITTTLALGTAATAATGTSGATLPFLNGVNTWSASQAFGAVTFSGNLSSAAALTNGVGLVSATPNYTDTSTTGGTIANAYLYKFSAANLETSTTTTYSNVYNTYFPAPTCSAGGGATPTCTSLWSAGFAGNVNFQLGFQATGGSIILNNNGSVSTTMGAGNNTGTNTIGNTSGGATTIASATMKLSNLATSSAAQTGTVCSGTGGLLTVDTTTTCLLSDGRFKMNVVALDAGLDEVMKLRPVSYDLKPEANPTGLGRQVGMIAQEVIKVDPRLAATYQSGPNKGTPSGVRYEQLTALLTKAVQELNSKVERQQLEIYGLLAWCLGLTGFMVLRRR